MKIFSEEQFKNQTQAEDMIKKQVSSQQMVETLINDLMDLAKFENEKFKFDEGYFSLYETIYEAVQMHLYSI